MRLWLQATGFFVAALLPLMSESATGPVPVASRPAISGDGNHMIEGIDVGPAWSWHLKLVADAQVGSKPMDRLALFRVRLSGGLALPGRLELGLALPAGALRRIGNPDLQPAGLNAGIGMGDLDIALLWNAMSREKAVGLLLGVIATLPTGDEHRMLGEASFAFEPVASLALDMFGTRLSFNLAYRLRTERSYFRDFEQDDEVVWRVALRVVKRGDVALSLFSEGAVGVATDEGLWPSRKSRPVLLGGGIDFPPVRLGRLFAYLQVGVDGETSPSALLCLGFQLGSVPPDEDGDGIGGLFDKCPLLPEDWDGFEDDDGCPDLDNDQDGFPDDEDRCPNTPAGEFSSDGC
jgi:hypothetical protein